MNDFRIKDLTMICCISIVSLILLKSNFRAYAAPSSNIQPVVINILTEPEVPANSTYESNSQTSSPWYEFKCKDGSLIGIETKCDGEIDCSDGSDEENCDCSEGFFKCNNGQCIDEEVVCNDAPDCPDGDDELGCPPRCVDGFQCQNKECIPHTQKCDGFPNCKDYSDEKDCSYDTKNDSCSEYEFSCRSSTSLCIPMLFFCDGKNDCIDNSDEMNCSNSEIHDISEIIKDSQASSSSDEFICKDGTLVGNETICDGWKDCPDGSDEESCDSQTSSWNDFICKDGTLVGKEAICDGKRDCADGFDEENCDCDEDFFKCYNGGIKCVPEYGVCDGYLHCEDGSDELHCTQLKF